MKYSIPIFTLLATTLFYGCKTLDNNNSELRVVGAREVAKKDYPSVAAIVLEQPMTKRYKFHCTVARVGEYTFLTSARCVYNIHTKSLLPFFRKNSELTLYYGKSFPEDTNAPVQNPGFSESSGSTFLTDSNSEGQLRTQTLETEIPPQEKNDINLNTLREASRYLVHDMGAFYLAKVRVSDVYLTPSFLENYKIYDDTIGGVTKTFVTYPDVAIFKITPELRIPQDVLPYSKINTSYDFPRDQAALRIGGYSYDKDAEGQTVHLRYEKFSSVEKAGYFYHLKDPAEESSIKMPRESMGGPVFRGDKESPYQDIVGINSPYNGKVHLSRFNFYKEDDKDELKKWFRYALGDENSRRSDYGPYLSRETSSQLKCKNQGTKTSEKLEFNYGAQVSNIPVESRYKSKFLTSMPSKITIVMKEREGSKDYSSTLYLDQLGSLYETAVGGFEYNFQYLGFDDRLKAYLQAEITFSKENYKHRLTIKAFTNPETFFKATTVLKRQIPDEIKENILSSKSNATQVVFDGLCDLL